MIHYNKTNGFYISGRLLDIPMRDVWHVASQYQVTLSGEALAKLQKDHRVGFSCPVCPEVAVVKITEPVPQCMCGRTMREIS